MTSGWYYPGKPRDGRSAKFSEEGTYDEEIVKDIVAAEA